MSRTATVVGLLVGTVLGIGAHAVGAQSMREAALARGANLPAPFGVGLSLYVQDQSYAIDKLSLGVPGIDPELAKSLDVKNRTKAAHFTADYWLLPFVDVYAILGEVKGTTDVKLSRINLGIPLDDIKVKYEGLVYGAGVTFAGGWDNYFGTVSFDYTNTSLDISSSSVKAWVATPTVGYAFDKLSLWAGGRYEKPEERHQGTFAVPMLGAVPYDVTLGSKNSWNYVAGVTTEIGQHWVLTLEGGFGKRTSGLAHLDYRF